MPKKNGSMRRVDLARAEHDQSLAILQIRAATGQLTADAMKLPVQIYDSIAQLRQGSRCLGRILSRIAAAISVVPLIYASGTQRCAANTTHSPAGALSSGGQKAKRASIPRWRVCVGSRPPRPVPCAF